MSQGIWKKKSAQEIQERVVKAIDQNVSYIRDSVLGVPGSYLDPLVFDQEASFLKDAPFLRSLLENPNHIGCHTLEASEPFFEGTHEIERDLLDICAIDILKASPGCYDGYVTSGGTEANIQAVWIYRNYFQQEYQSKNENILILCSEDTHYSLPKAANLLGLEIEKLPVLSHNRLIDKDALKQSIQNAKAAGKTCFIVICNMMTTMFGSVDDPEPIAEILIEQDVQFKIHVDSAYGGFYYPFSTKNNKITFENKHISSFTLDAHKIAQAPYGTGIFISRKGQIEHTNTKEARYVKGEDFTLIGSRSGANAIAVWMILSRYGKTGWEQKIKALQDRTLNFTNALDQKNIEYFRNPHSNIVTIKNHFVPESVAKKYYLVPDDHAQPTWQKIVVMEHVTQDKLDEFLIDLTN